MVGSCGVSASVIPRAHKRSFKIQVLPLALFEIPSSISGTYCMNSQLNFGIDVETVDVETVNEISG